MAYTGVLCTEAEIAVYAGENVDVTGDTEANRNLLVAQAEGNCVILSKYDWVGNVGSLGDAAKGILAEYCSRFVATGLIMYNLLGWGSRIIAEDIVNVHLFRLRQIEKQLENQDIVNYLT